MGLRTRRALALAASVMFVAAGCGSTGTATPTTATSTGTPAAPTATPTAVASANGIDITDSKYASGITAAAKTGGTVVVSDWQSPDFVNPYYYDAEVDVESFGMSFDSMVVVTQNLGYIPNLASEVPTTANGDVVVNGSTMDLTWKLKPNMTWSDGSPINCDDVIATWKWIMDKDNTGLAAGTTGWEDITSIDGAGTTTCVVHFGKIYEGYLTLWAPLLPAKYIQSVPVKDAPTKLYPLADPASGVYSGPYIPTSYQTDAQVTFKANPNWATIGLGSNLHAPYLDQVIFKLYGGDPTLMIKGFTAGEIDLAQDLQNADIPSLTGVPTNEQVIHDSLTYELHAYNNAAFQKKFGSDWQTVIKAVKMATDRQAIAAGPLQGNVTVTNNFISPLTWYYKDEGGNTAADPAGAAALLASAGFTKDANGILAKGGQEIEPDLLHHDGPGARRHHQAGGQRTQRDRHQGRCPRRSSRASSSAPTTARRPTRSATCCTATTTSPSTPTSRRSTRWAATPSTCRTRTPTSASTTAPTRRGSTSPPSTPPTTRSRTAWTWRPSRTAMGRSRTSTPPIRTRTSCRSSCARTCG